jgi:hypothetical protein
MKKLIVPEDDLIDIEQARQQIIHIAEKIEAGAIHRYSIVTSILEATEPLWKVANKKYKETFLSKIRNYF